MTKDVILIGAARSGTKWLRSVLSASSQIKEIPFDVNFIWRTGQHQYPHDRLDPDVCTPDLASKIRGKLHKSAAIGKEQIFLEKTVSNTLRVPFVARVFPDAKYVHLLRDGRDVIESSYRQWLAPTNFSYLLGKLRHFPLDDWQYAVWYLRNLMRRSDSAPIWGPRYPGIEVDVAEHGVFAACCRQWVQSVELAQEDLAHINAEQVFEVRYEELTSSVGALQHCTEFLGLNDGDKVARHYQDTLQAGLGGQWQQKLSPEQQEIMQRVAGPTLEKLNYL